jgi:hypothetical protein
VAEDKLDAVFLDTSIQIAQVVHGPNTKARIRQRLARHEHTVTGLVVRQEFKRRLLAEAEYLLRQLHRYQSLQEVQQHLIQLYGDWPSRKRKRNICLQTLTQVHGGTDAECTERMQLYLRSLLVTGLKRFDQRVDTVRRDSGCACARLDVVEKVELRKYDLGPKHCSRTRPGECAVVQFLAHQHEARERILRLLRSLPHAQKSGELRKAERFLVGLSTKLNQAQGEDPCLSVGDLLIALESLGVSNFYTLNSAESQHLCRALEQTLIVCPIDPLKPEIVCAKDAAEWPSFGKKQMPDGP